MLRQVLLHLRLVAVLAIYRHKALILVVNELLLSALLRMCLDHMLHHLVVSSVFLRAAGRSAAMRPMPVLPATLMVILAASSVVSLAF